MKKIFGILICMLVVMPVVSMATGQDVKTNKMLPPKTRNTVDVSIEDFYFTPTPVTIHVGDTVRWTNLGSAPHSSTSDSNIWDSGILSNGQSFSFTFNVAAGTYPYHCSVHTFMHGTVIVTSGNLPPNNPSKPTGPTTLSVSQSGNYSTSTIDPDGDQVQYMFDWDATGAHDYSTWSNLVPSGQSVTMSHSWITMGTYVVEAQARDSNGSMSSWSSGLTVLVTSGGNLPPNTPTINGPASGKSGVQLTYIAVTTDPENENVAYLFDWGDGSNSGWTTYVSSGTMTSENHTWMMKGTYTVKVKAKDTNNLESSFATLTVNVPRFTALNIVLSIFLERFPYAFPVMRHLLGV